ncbi:MAG: MraY family glycosyltransferase [Candidatus Doudnabacteria bacterium]
MLYIYLFVLTVILSSLLVPLVKRIALKLNILDVPAESRKIHKVPIPLLGGLGIFISFFAVLALYLFFIHPDSNIIPTKFYWGMFFGALILMWGGFLDDRFNVPPQYQVIFPVLAVITVVNSGIGSGITYISNPFGPAIQLGYLFFGISISSIFVFSFILGMIYTTKFLDGMDGLASGISFIASLTLFFLSLTPKINQSITASIAIIFCGAILGFLFYNFNPASIFLGESGSTLMGFMLGVLSVLLGGKIATAVLVMGIPIMDIAWVIARRLWFGVSPFKADRKHLHFRLLDIGFSQKQTVLILYFIAIVFGSMAIFLQSLGKLISMIVLLFVMISIALSTVVVFKYKHPYDPEAQGAVEGTERK